MTLVPWSSTSTRLLAPARWSKYREITVFDAGRLKKLGQSFEDGYGLPDGRIPGDYHSVARNDRLAKCREVARVFQAVDEGGELLPRSQSRRPSPRADERRLGNLEVQLLIVIFDRYLRHGV